MGGIPTRTFVFSVGKLFKTTERAYAVLEQNVRVFDRVSARLADVIAFFRAVWHGLKEGLSDHFGSGVNAWGEGFFGGASTPS